MAIPGDELTNPVDGTRMTFGETSGSSDGRRLVLEWSVPPGSRLVAIPHVHPNDEERWEVLGGTARYWLGRHRHVGAAPHEYVVTRGTGHIHPANIGRDPLHLRQTLVTEPADPGKVGGVERYFETVYALARMGKVDRFGNIRNPLQSAVTIRELLTPGTYIAGIPTPIQAAVLDALAALGRRRGYTAYVDPAAAGPA